MANLEIIGQIHAPVRTDGILFLTFPFARLLALSVKSDRWDLRQVRPEPGLVKSSSMVLALAIIGCRFSYVCLPSAHWIAKFRTGMMVGRRSSEEEQAMVGVSTTPRPSPLFWVRQAFLLMLGLVPHVLSPSPSTSSSSGEEEGGASFSPDVASSSSSCLSCSPSSSRWLMKRESNYLYDNDLWEWRCSSYGIPKCFWRARYPNLYREEKFWDHLIWTVKSCEPHFISISSNAMNALQCLLRDKNSSLSDFAITILVSTARRIIWE